MTSRALDWEVIVRLQMGKREGLLAACDAG